MHVYCMVNLVTRQNYGMLRLLRLTPDDPVAAMLNQGIEHRYIWLGYIS